MKPEENQPVSRSQDSTKKAYEKPQLEVYGDLKQITQTVGMTGHFDGKITGSKFFTHS